MVLEGLVNKRGPLSDVFSYFDAGTIQHADEITTARRYDISLRNKYLWTADFHMYTVEDDEKILYLARRKDNPIFKNMEAAAEQLKLGLGYVPEKRDIETVKESALRINLAELDLKILLLDYKYSSLRIDTADYGRLNPSKRAFAERVYGQGEDFEKNMKMFSDEGITANIVVLSPDFVGSIVEEGGAIARAGLLGSFYIHSNFDAALKDVANHYMYLRGVPIAAKGGAQKD